MRPAHAGFKIRAAYVGGHPGAVRPTEGHLELAGDRLSWHPGWRGRVHRAAGKVGRRLPFSRDPEPFAINVAAIVSVDFQGDETFKLGPSGYVRLPGALTGYGGSQPRHPLGVGKLTKALTVRFEDDAGVEHEVVWANTSDDWTFTGPLAIRTSDRGGYEIANIIRVAATTARASRSS